MSSNISLSRGRAVPEDSTDSTDSTDTEDSTDPRATGVPDLCAEYTQDSFFFASPERTLLAQGGSPVTDVDSAPFVAGALPFDPALPPHLTAPLAVCQSERSSAGGTGRSPVRGPWELHPVPSAADYERGVARAVSMAGRGELDKVVLSRALHLHTEGRIDVSELLRRLAGADPRGYVFAVALPSADGPRTLIGATPELLVSKSGSVVCSHPLAGSRPRDLDPVRDRANAAELLGSAKDRREHAIVADAVADALRPFCVELDVPAEPSLVDTAAMWHLGTRITGRLADPAISSVTLARALHPTPAVCGTPERSAMAAIADLEPFDRGFFTGAVGWSDWTGDGEWVVAIRCAEVAEHSARLFAGAGIVADSQPSLERAETSAKFRTLLSALGLEE